MLHFAKNSPHSAIPDWHDPCLFADCNNQGIFVKGLVFTELVSFLERTHGVITADRIIVAARLPNDGAFTSVGNYPSAQALTIIGAAAELTGTPIEMLCQDYGSFLYGRLVALFPAIIAHYGTAEAMLGHVASHIHEEVMVLYPDARPPRIETEVRDGLVHVHYESHRPLAHLAFGLIRQCLVDFGDPREVRWLPGGTMHNAAFVLAPHDLASAA